MMLARWCVSLPAFALVACGRPAPPPIVDVPPPAASASVARADAPPARVVDRGPPAAEPSLGERLLRQWSSKALTDGFDYGADGGIQTFWDHRPSSLTVAQVASWAGVDIFVNGPHSTTELVLDDNSQFGHYNPAFVKWLVEKTGPSARDSDVQKATQAAYDLRMKPLAEIFYFTLAKTRADHECFEKEKNSYSALLAKKKLPADYHERWFYFMNPGYCDRIKRGIPFGSDGPTSAFDLFSDNGFDGGLNGNVTKSVVGFWVRRSLDGTMDSFADGLTKLLTTYEPELLAHAYRPPDVHAIDGFLTKSVAKAQKCALGLGLAQRQVDVRVQPNGNVTTPSSNQCIRAAFEGTIPAFDGKAIAYRRDLGH